jgi:transcription elongation factor Elf1
LEVYEPIQFKAGELRCPRCLSKDLVPSLPRGLLDAVMRGMHRIPRHCKACGKRFYVRIRKAAEAARAAE